MTYSYACPDHGPFDLRRPMAESGQPGPCPACEAPCPRVFCFNPRTQMLLPNKFRTNFGTTGFKTFYGGGGWENHVRDYHRWDSDFAGPTKDNDAPPDFG